MGGATPGQGVVPASVKKQAEQALETSQWAALFHGFWINSCSQVPAGTSLDAILQVIR